MLAQWKMIAATTFVAAAVVASCIPDALAPMAEVPVASVSVDPPLTTVLRGDSTQLTASVMDSSGQLLSDQAVVWSSADTSVATVSKHGVVKGKARGSTTVRAEKKGVRGASTVTVDTASSTPPAPAPAPVASVSVSPASGSIEAGRTLQLTATTKDASGNVLTGRTIGWATSNGSVATVSSNGLVTGVSAGSATITATSEGKSGQASVTVTAPSAPPPPPPPSPNGLAVVPGLEGFGTTTPAGRGGAVRRVTNLNDTGPGSLREAVTGSGPRVVIFEVSGTITLASNLMIESPYITVAGQTAPSPGITLRGAAIRVNTHDVLIQHLRIRVGDGSTGPSPGSRDALQLYGSNVYNVVVDHVSASWGIDENASTSTSGTRHDITISNSIISEGLHDSLHPDGPHSKGILIGQGSKNIAIIGTVVAHHMDRSPFFKGNTSGIFVNNVVYNWGGSKASFFDDVDNTAAQLGSVVGNVYLRGANTPDVRPIRVYAGVKSGTQIYVSDNTLGRAVPPADPWSLVTNDAGSRVVASAPPVWPTGLTARPVGTVESWVLGNAGARPADRDAVDLRIVAEVRTGTGRVINSQNEVGGWPVLAQNVRALTPPSDLNGDVDGDGYTNLEEWLHGYAAEVEGR